MWAGEGNAILDGAQGRNVSVTGDISVVTTVKWGNKSSGWLGKRSPGQWENKGKAVRLVCSREFWITVLKLVRKGVVRSCCSENQGPRKFKAMIRTLDFM